MSGKFRAVAVLIAALLAFGYVFTLNPGLTEFKIVPGKEPIRTSFALIVFLFFLAGFGLAVFATAFQGALRSFAFWRFARSSQRKDEARQLVVEGRSTAALGKTGAARRLLQRAQRKSPGEAYVALETARVELADGKLDQAERRLKGLLKEAPKNTEVLTLMLELYARRENFEGQVATLTRWLEVDPGHLGALRNLRDLYAGVGNWAEAARVQGRILAKVITRSERTAERRRLSLFRYREAATLPPARAKELLQRLVREDEGFASGHAALGDALLAQGDREGALRAWLRGYQSNGQAGLLLKIEAARDGDGQPEELLKQYRKLGKKGGIPLLLHARLLLKLGRHEDALKLLDGDAEGVGGTRAGLLLVAEAHRRAGAADSAAETFRRAWFGGDEDLSLAFSCDQCHHGATEWAAVCNSCGAVDSLSLDAGAVAPRHD